MKQQSLEKVIEKEKTEEKEMRFADMFGGSLNIIGMKIDIGKLFELAERPGGVAYDLEKLRSELEEKLYVANPAQWEDDVRKAVVIGRLD